MRQTATTTNQRRRGTIPQPLDAARLPESLLTIKTVRALTSLSPASIYRKVAASDFPQPVRLGSRCTRWRAGDVTAWLAQQAKAA